MNIVTYQFTYIGNSSRDERLHTTLIDVPLMDWWTNKMDENHHNALQHEDRKISGYYKILALVFAQEIPDGEYPDIEWYSSKEAS